MFDFYISLMRLSFDNIAVSIFVVILVFGTCIIFVVILVDFDEQTCLQKLWSLSTM